MVQILLFFHIWANSPFIANNSSLLFRYGVNIIRFLGRWAYQLVYSVLAKEI